MAGAVLRLGGKGAGQTFQKQHRDWDCWAGPTAAISPRPHSLPEKFLLLVAPGTSGCQPRAQGTVVTCCLCHTPLAPRCFLPLPFPNLCCFRQKKQRHCWSLPGLFFHLISLLKPAIPLESSAQPDPPAHAANVHKISGRHSHTALCPLQTTPNCSSEWGYLKTKLCSAASLVPSPRQPR